MNEPLLLPKLRHGRWMGWTEVPGRDLVKMPLPNLPKVGVGEDTPQRYVYVQEKDLAERSLAEWEAIGVANLAKRPGAWTVKEKAGGVLGFGAKASRLEFIDEFACERILDVAFMKKAHELLKAPLIAAAIPVRGILWAVPAATDPEVIGRFIALARAGFVNAPENMEPISPVVFTVSDGVVVGMVQGMTGEGDGIDRDVIEPANGFPWPVQPVNGEDEDESDDDDEVDDEDKRLHMVGYIKQLKLVEFGCYVGEGEAIPDAQLRELAAWVKLKATPSGDPIAEVRVSFPDESVARRAADQIRPTGARIVYMGNEGQDVYL